MRAHLFNTQDLEFHNTHLNVCVLGLYVCVPQGNAPSYTLNYQLRLIVIQPQSCGATYWFSLFSKSQKSKRSGKLSTCGNFSSQSSSFFTRTLSFPGHRELVLISNSHVHVFDLWGKTRENSLRENMQMLSRKGGKPVIFLLWGDSSNHCSTAPSHIIHKNYW